MPTTEKAGNVSNRRSGLHSAKGGNRYQPQKNTVENRGLEENDFLVAGSSHAKTSISTAGGNSQLNNKSMFWRNNSIELK